MMIQHLRKQLQLLDVTWRLEEKGIIQKMRHSNISDDFVDIWVRSVMHEIYHQHHMVLHSSA